MSQKQLFFFNVLLIVSVSCSAQTFYNLDVEYIDEQNALPEKWYIIEERGCAIRSDSNVIYSGKKSLLIYPQTASLAGSTTIINELQTSLYKDKKRIKLVAHVKLDSLKSNVRLLCKQLTSSGQEIATVSMSEKKLRTRTGDWIPLMLEQQIDPATEHLAFGFSGSVRDSLWIDAFEIYLDDIKIIEKLPLVNGPTPDEVEWLDNNCSTIDLRDSRTLVGLSRALRNLNIVALGEVTHGSSEIYKLKRLIVERLVAEDNYSILAMEMSAYDASVINKCILTGVGDINSVLMNTNYWTWRTREFADLINWLCDFNQNHSQKIQVIGFDISIAGLLPDKDLEQALQVDAELLSYLRTIDETYRKISLIQKTQLDSLIKQVDRLSNYLQRKKIGSRGSVNALYATVEYKVLTLKQAALYAYFNAIGRRPTYRDECLAENLSWIIENNRDSKVIIWAHNEHIKKAENSGSMGAILKKKYDFYSLGFALGEGTLNAIDQSAGNVTQQTLAPPSTRSYESFFLKSKHTFCFIDFRNLKKVKWSDWIFQERKFRFVGAAVPTKYHFVETQLTADFDALIFIRQSTASSLLGQK